MRVVDYGIRGLHLAYDLLDGCDRLVLVDALPDRGAPGHLEVLEIRPRTSRAARSTPTAWTRLPSWPRPGSPRRRPAPHDLVGVQVADVSERIGLSPAVEQAVPAAVDAVRRLLAQWLPAARTQEVG